jgi:site-specific recombinase XerD
VQRLSSLRNPSCFRRSGPRARAQWPPEGTLLWSGEGKTPAIGDHQARELLTAHGEETVKEKRDRAILSTLLYHALRREKLCRFKVRDSGTHDAACRISRSPARARDAVSAIAPGGDQRAHPPLGHANIATTHIYDHRKTRA